MSEQGSDYKNAENYRLNLAYKATMLLVGFGFSENNESKQEKAMAALIKITASLLGGLAILARNQNAYALAALSRQLVEVEYLICFCQSSPIG